MPIRGNLSSPKELAVEIVTGLDKNLESPLDRTTTDALEILLEGQLANHVARYNDLHNQYTASEAEIIKLTTSYERRIDDLQRRLADERGRKKSDIDEAVASVAESHDTFARKANDDVLELEEKIVYLEGSLYDATLQANNKKTLADRLEREKKAITIQFEMAQENAKGLQGKVKELERELQDAQEESENWRVEIENTLVQKEADNKAHDRQLRKGSQEFEQRYNELSAVIASKEQTVLQQREIIRELETELQDAIEYRNRPQPMTPVMTRRTINSLRTSGLRTSSLRPISESEPNPLSTAELLGSIDLLNSEERHQELQESLEADYITAIIHERMMEGKEHEILGMKEERDGLLKRIEELEDEATRKNVGAAAAGDLRAKTQALQSELREAKDKVARLEQMKDFQGLKLSRQQTRLEELKTRAILTTRSFGAGGARRPSGKLAELWDELADVEGRLRVHQTLLDEAKHERFVLRQQQIQDTFLHALKESEDFYAQFLGAIEAALGPNSDANKLRDILARQAVDFIRHRRIVFKAVQKIIPRPSETHRKYGERTMEWGLDNKPAKSRNRPDIGPKQDSEIAENVEENVRALHDRFAKRLELAQGEIRALRTSGDADTDYHTKNEIVNAMAKELDFLEKKRHELNGLIDLSRALDKMITNPTTDPNDILETVGTFLELYMAIISPSVARLTQIQLALVSLTDATSTIDIPPNARRQLEASAKQLYDERVSVRVVILKQVRALDKVQSGLEAWIRDLLGDNNRGTDADADADPVGVVERYGELAERLKHTRDLLLQNAAGLPQDHVMDLRAARVALPTWGTPKAKDEGIVIPVDNKNNNNNNKNTNVADDAWNLRDTLLPGAAAFFRDTLRLFLAALKHFLVWVPLAGAFGAMVVATIAEARLYADWQDANAYSRALWMSMLKRPTFCFGPLDWDYIWYAVTELLPEEWGYRY